MTLSWKVTKATRANSRKVWLYSRGNYTRACQIIEGTDWDQILNGHDVDTAAELWTEKFLSIMNICITSWHLPTRQNLPWLSPDIVHLIRKRNIMFRKAKKTMKFSHISKYKPLRNKVVALLRRSKNRFFNDLANTDKKSFWKSVKTLNKNRVNIPSLKLGGNAAVCDTDKANMLNAFFARCWNTAEPLLTEPTYTKDLSSDSPYDDSFVSPEEVLFLIWNLDVKKANGPDGISAYMLKATAESITYSLPKLFSLSLSAGKFPALWKSVHVVPVPKSLNKVDASNYRPISLLSIVGKLLEKYVYSLL